MYTFCNKLILLLVVLWTNMSTTNAQDSAIAVFESGKDGYKSFRIPAMITTGNGTILAFCEGRANGSDDFGNINIVMKSSNDKGKTWNTLKTIVDYGHLQAGNPAPVVDYKDPNFADGRIFLFYNTGNNHEYEVRKGKGLREVWYKTSTDNGATWSEGTNITLQTHYPKQPLVNPSYDFKEDWRTYANTPGHAIQLQRGKYKGRILIAANHSSGDPLPNYEDYHAHAFYTDDHGSTFKLSQTVQVPGSNESMATALSGDKVLMNTRNQRGDVRARIVSISNNGGESWDTTYFDTTLIDPVNQASILMLGYKKNKAIIAFCNTADIKKRDHLTLRISFDEGKTWKKKYIIDESSNPEQADFTAYSDMIIMNKKHVGILYERNNYQQIVFKKVKW